MKNLNNPLNNRDLTTVTLPNLDTDSDGVSFINVTNQGLTELGTRLAYGYPKITMTIFGPIGNVRNFMEAISTPGYPLKLLNKKRLKPNEIESIPKARIQVPNYWAAVAYVVCERIIQDPKLMSLIKKNTLPYTSIRSNVKKILLGEEVKVVMVNEKMGRYLGIVRCIDKMIKEDTFNYDTIKVFIESCKDKPNQDIFADINIGHVIPGQKTEAVEKEETPKQD